jgi:glycosyltransferase involved in cell wall biosynthesis
MSIEPKIVWLVDWTDTEQANFEAACAELGIKPRFVRSQRTGITYGRWYHRFNTYSAYLYLAARGWLSRADVLIVFQSFVCVPLVMLPKRPKLIAWEPILRENDRGVLQRVFRWAVQRADLILPTTEAQAERVRRMGFRREQVVSVKMGVVPAIARNSAGEPYMLGGGREHRDWDTLREAAKGLDIPVKLGAPNPPDVTEPLEILPTLSHEDYVDVMKNARALIVPLIDSTRGAGVHAVMQAYAHGVPVIITRNPTTEEYVGGGAGELVDAGDVAQLHAAMKRLADPVEAERASRDAHTYVTNELSLTNFVGRVYELATEVAQRR